MAAPCRALPDRNRRVHHQRHRVFGAQDVAVPEPPFDPHARVAYTRVAFEDIGYSFLFAHQWNPHLHGQVSRQAASVFQFELGLVSRRRALSMNGQMYVGSPFAGGLVTHHEERFMAAGGSAAADNPQAGSAMKNPSIHCRTALVIAA